MKVCSKCGVEKPLSEFYAKRTNCKVCHSADVAKCQAKNPEAAKARFAKWRAENLEKARESVRKSYAKYANELSPQYIAKVLRSSIKDLPPELIEAKREQIQLHRLGKQIKEALK